ncbi:hypothetical protein BFP70_17775 [Thioclava sp. SK-1]|uniref:DUF4123 domain-containing protein n=1 Tax=Thioclava sp. SK-1 TaxID=1889770 RepID=UPI000824158D|nr:DUF4123 domain-containing protein [Thioclava sp. SK-1]OCX60459.1 hypothetical protein BFP70_17775 [Thioclava sp. SK-1]
MNEPSQETWLAIAEATSADGRRFEACVAGTAATSITFMDTLRTAFLGRGWPQVTFHDVMRADEALGDYHLDGEVAALLLTIKGGETLAFGRLRAAGEATHRVCHPHWLDLRFWDGVAPLDAQIGAVSRRTVPEALQAAFFGDPAGDANPVLPPLRLFAVLDAAALPLLEERLETSGLRYRALFKGAAQEELSAAAPWLVELQDGNSFTRKLFTSTGRSSGLFDAGPGFFVRSRVDLDVLWAHLRKFTRLREPDGKWLFFRFWTEPVMSWFLACGNRAELRPLLSALLPEGPEAPVEAILRYNQTLCLEARRRPDGPAVRPNMVMTPEIRETVRLLRLAEEFEELIGIAIEHSIPSGAAGRDPMHMRAHLRARREPWYALGFWRRDHFVKLCVWELLLGPNFLENYAAGAIRAIVARGGAPHETIDAIERYLDREYALELGYTEEELDALK